jgi:flagellar hook assembly protein FlgD
MDNNQMASQLAQLAQLEQVESINNKFDAVLDMTQRVQAASLIGKEVLFVPRDSDEGLWGQVSSVDIIDGSAVLQAGGHSIPLGAIQSIRNEVTNQEE